MSGAEGDAAARAARPMARRLMGPELTPTVHRSTSESAFPEGATWLLFMHPYISPGEYMTLAELGIGVGYGPRSGLG